MKITCTSFSGEALRLLVMVLDLRDGDILLQRMFEKDRNPLVSRKTVILAYKTSVGGVLGSLGATIGSKNKKRGVGTC